MPRKTDPNSPQGKKIREQALAVLRDTRSKIDPALLVAMKERLSTLVPSALAQAQAPVAKTPPAPPVSAPTPATPKTPPLSKDAPEIIMPALKPFAQALKAASTEPPAKENAAIPLPKQEQNKPADRPVTAVPTPTPQVIKPISKKTVVPEAASIKPKPVPADAEPVDRQKITQIVLEYMKQRQETQKH